MNNELITALQHTMSPDQTIRNNAEQYLSTNQQAFGFVTSLIGIASEASMLPEVQLAAAVQLKNTIRRFWKRPEPDDYGIQIVDPNLYEISAAEKDQVRQLLLHTAVSTAHLINSD